MTFWGTKYFKNVDDVEIPLGAKVKQPILRLVNEEDIVDIETTQAIYTAPLVAAMSFIVLTAFCGGRLLPTWMFLNSMQLILHVIMIKSDMPSNAQLFFLDFLDKLRLKFDWSEELTESNVGSPARDDYEALQKDEYFSVHIKDCGYHYSWLNNLFVFICIAGLIFLVWLLLLLKDCIMRRCMNKKSTNEAFMANFSLRFLYEVVFEICLATVIYLSLTDNSNALVLSICIVTILAIFASLVFCLSRAWTNGPNVK